MLMTCGAIPWVTAIPHNELLNVRWYPIAGGGLVRFGSVGACSIQCLPVGVMWSTHFDRGTRRCRIMSTGRRLVISCPIKNNIEFKKRQIDSSGRSKSDARNESGFVGSYFTFSLGKHNLMSWNAVSYSWTKKRSASKIGKEINDQGTHFRRILSIHGQHPYQNAVECTHSIIVRNYDWNKDSKDVWVECWGRAMMFGKKLSHIEKRQCYPLMSTYIYMRLFRNI